MTSYIVVADIALAPDDDASLPSLRASVAQTLRTCHAYALLRLQSLAPENSLDIILHPVCLGPLPDGGTQGLVMPFSDVGYVLRTPGEGARLESRPRLPCGVFRSTSAVEALDELFPSEVPLARFPARLCSPPGWNRWN